MARTIADDQILEAALALIAEQGYAGATTREIAAAAGVNEVTLFRRFGSKKGLLMAAVEREVQHLSVAGIEYTGDLEADLVRVVRFYHELMAQRGRMLVMLLSEAPRQPELLEIMQTPMAIIGKIGALLQRYQQEERLIEEPVGQAFAALVGPLFFSGVFEVIEPGLLTAPFNAAKHVRRYLQGRLP